MSLPFCNNLRKGDEVDFHGRRGVVHSQPRETSTKVHVLFDGINTPRYVPVIDLRLVIDGKPEDVAPIDGVPAGQPEPTKQPQHKPISDAELIALSALANVEAVLMAGDNACRALDGHAPAWRDGCGMMPAGTALSDELYRRRIIK